MAQNHIIACLATAAATVFIIHSVLPDFLFHESRLVNLILDLIFMLVIYQLIKWHFCDDKTIDFINKAVLITGCDSGFGNRLAKRLDSKGFHVFASCLFPQGTGADELKQTCSNRLKVLPLDVTSDESVANALKFVEENLGSNVLWAVVNNAGISKGSAVDFSTIEHFRDTIDVNTLGPVRVSKAFLPLLKKSKGRVVNVNSILGRIPMALLCPYVMSKHASIAFSECFCLEMSVWGVRVISIEPETFRTAITETTAVINRLKAERKEIDESIISSYGEEYFENLEQPINTMTKWSSSNIDIVVDAMESAITKQRPDPVYKPRWSLLSKVLIYVTQNIPFSYFEKLFYVTSKILQFPIPNDAKM